MHLRFFKKCSLLAILFSSFALGAEEVRKWKNPDGSKEFSAQFIKREKDQVTVQMANGKEASFSMNKLHVDDQNWLKKNHPTEEERKAAEEKEASSPVHGAVFDKLKFGDSRDTVLAKLKKSKLVQSGLADALIGRTGLNGVYRMVKPIAGVDCFLFFGWDEQDRLIDLTLSSQEKKADEYVSALTPCWEKMIEMVSSIYGDPLQAKPMPAVSSLVADQLSATHYWKIPQGGMVILGASKVDELYQVAIRFNPQKL